MRYRTNFRKAAFNQFPASIGDMEPYKLTKREIETICQMALRQTMPSVKEVEIRQEPGSATWELYAVSPTPNPRELEFAMPHIREIQSAFQIRTED